MSEIASKNQQRQQEPQQQSTVPKTWYFCAGLYIA